MHIHKIMDASPKHGPRKGWSKEYAIITERYLDGRYLGIDSANEILVRYFNANIAPFEEEFCHINRSSITIKNFKDSFSLKRDMQIYDWYLMARQGYLHKNNSDIAEEFLYMYNTYKDRQISYFIPLLWNTEPVYIFNMFNDENVYKELKLNN